MPLTQFLYKRKYELLLMALLLHLFGGIFIRNMFIYQAIIWPVNMLLLGMAGFQILAGKSRWKRIIQYCLFLPAIVLPLGAHVFRHSPIFFTLLSIVFVIFFLFTFSEVILFLIRPGYINVDIVSAAACGYLLLVEIATFVFELCFYQNRESFKGSTQRSIQLFSTTLFISAALLSPLSVLATLLRRFIIRNCLPPSLALPDKFIR